MLCQELVSNAFGTVAVGPYIVVEDDPGARHEVGAPAPCVIEHAIVVVVAVDVQQRDSSAIASGTECLRVNLALRAVVLRPGAGWQAQVVEVAFIIGKQVDLEDA